MVARKKPAPKPMTLEDKAVRVRELAIEAAKFVQQGQSEVAEGDGNGAALSFRLAADALEAWQLVYDSYRAQQRDAVAAAEHAATVMEAANG